MPVIDGVEVTYDRYRFQMSIRARATMNAVERIATSQALEIVEVARDFTQQELGGYLRQIMTPLVDQYGQVNAQAAVDYYDAVRNEWDKNQPAFAGSYGEYRSSSRNESRRGRRFAEANVRAQIYVATKPEFDLAGKVDGLVNYSMKTATQESFDAMKPALANSLTRALASYHRDTNLYNSGLDSAVVKVQRVARADACSFCRVLAFESYAGSDVRTTTYAIDFHDNCHCTIETLYLGDKPIKPPYYDQFEAEYDVATKFVYSRDYVYPNTQGRATGAKEIFSAMRQTAGTK
jgi:hypothetical protein